MFGKSREEDYDRYNEEVNSKYDDDYISDNREYREECSHEHGITYDNYDEAPERTYDDAESSIGFTLQPGERLIWSGSTDKRSKMRERGGCGCILLFPILWLFMSLLTFVPLVLVDPVGAIMSGSFVVVGLVMFIFIRRLCSPKGVYALTDRRVMARVGSTTKEMSLRKIRTANGVDLGRGLGWVRFVPRTSGTQELRYAEITGFYGIKDPKEVSKLINDTINEYYRTISKVSK